MRGRSEGPTHPGGADEGEKGQKAEGEGKRDERRAWTAGGTGKGRAKKEGRRNRRFATNGGIDVRLV